MLVAEVGVRWLFRASVFALGFALGFAAVMLR